jgi:hypothetical protein
MKTNVPLTENMQNKLFTEDQALQVGAVTRRARISKCGKYRFALVRSWDKSKPFVMFMMLNPSTADAEKDDPTIRRCMAFAKVWGYGGICVGNLFPYRATDPSELLIADHVLPYDNFPGENLQWIGIMAKSCELVICAWGNAHILKKFWKKNIYEQYAPLKQFVTKLRYLELSKDNTPKHPLYLKGDLTPKKFEPSPLRFFTLFW